jgi:hypothetical protein
MTIALRLSTFSWLQTFHLNEEDVIDFVWTTWQKTDRSTWANQDGWYDLPDEFYRRIAIERGTDFPRTGTGGCGRSFHFAMKLNGEFLAVKYWEGGATSDKTLYLFAHCLLLGDGPNGGEPVHMPIPKEMKVRGDGTIIWQLDPSGDKVVQIPEGHVLWPKMFLEPEQHWPLAMMENLLQSKEHNPLAVLRSLRHEPDRFVANELVRQLEEIRKALTALT